jgi:hypothetical protein
MSYEKTHQITKETYRRGSDKTDHLPKGTDTLSAGVLISYRTGRIAHYEPYIHTTIGSDNPSSRYPSLSHNTPRSNFIEERQAMRYI